MPTMENTPKQSLVAAALILAAGFVASTGIASNTAYKVKALANTVSVTGSADKKITSDQAKWNARFTRTVAPDGLKQGSVQIRADLEAAKTFLAAAGIKPEEITVKPLNTYPQYSSGYNGEASRITGYTLDQSFTVESSDVPGITKLSQDAATKFFENGAVFTTDSLEYYYSKFADLKIEMMGEATENAKARAAKIAESTGSGLGALQSASMGVFQVTAPNSVDVQDYGAYDTSTIEKKVTAVVRGSFLLR